MAQALLTTFAALFSIIQVFLCQERLIELEDLETLDQKIHSFLKNPSQDGWEGNLGDIDRYDASMKSMITSMNATSECLTKDYLSKVERFVHNGKPFFIDTDVVEYEVQPRLGLTDDQLQKLYWARLRAEQDWETVVDMLKAKETGRNQPAAVEH